MPPKRPAAAAGVAGCIRANKTAKATAQSRKPKPRLDLVAAAVNPQASQHSDVATAASPTTSVAMAPPNVPPQQQAAAPWTSGGQGVAMVGQQGHLLVSSQNTAPGHPVAVWSQPLPASVAAGWGGPQVPAPWTNVRVGTQQQQQQQQLSSSSIPQNRNPQQRFSVPPSSQTAMVGVARGCACDPRTARPYAGESTPAGKAHTCASAHDHHGCCARPRASAPPQPPSTASTGVGGCDSESTALLAEAVRTGLRQVLEGLRRKAGRTDAAPTEPAVAAAEPSTKDAAASAGSPAQCSGGALLAGAVAELKSEIAALGGRILTAGDVERALQKPIDGVTEKLVAVSQNQRRVLDTLDAIDTATSRRLASVEEEQVRLTRSLGRVEQALVQMEQALRDKQVGQDRWHFERETGATGPLRVAPHARVGASMDIHGLSEAEAVVTESLERPQNDGPQQPPAGHADHAKGIHADDGGITNGGPSSPPAPGAEGSGERPVKEGRKAKPGQRKPATKRKVAAVGSSGGGSAHGSGGPGQATRLLTRAAHRQLEMQKARQQVETAAEREMGPGTTGATGRGSIRRAIDSRRHLPSSSSPPPPLYERELTPPPCAQPRRGAAVGALVSTSATERRAADAPRDVALTDDGRPVPSVGRAGENVVPGNGRTLAPPNVVAAAAGMGGAGPAGTRWTQGCGEGKKRRRRMLLPPPSDGTDPQPDDES